MEIGVFSAFMRFEILLSDFRWEQEDVLYLHWLGIVLYHSQYFYLVCRRMECFTRNRVIVPVKESFSNSRDNLHLRGINKESWIFLQSEVM